MAFFFPTLHVRKTRKCPRGAWKAGWQFPNVTRPELKVRGRPIFILTLHVRKTGSSETGKGSSETGSGSATQTTRKGSRGPYALRVLFTEHKIRLALRLALCVCPSRSLCALCGTLTTSGHYQR